MATKQIEATILGQSYVLACPPDGDKLLLEAVAIVDREMSAIRDAGKVKARERMAVLAALNLAYQRAEQARTPQAAGALGGTVARAFAAPTSSAAPVTNAAAAPAIDVDQLIRRIDQALGDDGHLL